MSACALEIFLQNNIVYLPMKERNLYIMISTLRVWGVNLFCSNSKIIGDTDILVSMTQPEKSDLLNLCF